MLLVFLCCICLSWTSFLLSISLWQIPLSIYLFSCVSDRIYFRLCCLDISECFKPGYLAFWDCFPASCVCGDLLIFFSERLNVNIMVWTILWFWVQRFTERFTERLKIDWICHRKAENKLILSVIFGFGVENWKRCFMDYRAPSHQANTNFLNKRNWRKLMFFMP